MPYPLPFLPFLFLFHLDFFCKDQIFRISLLLASSIHENRFGKKNEDRRHQAPSLSVTKMLLSRTSVLYTDCLWLKRVTIPLISGNVNETIIQ